MLKSIEAVTPQVTQQPWGTETLLAETPAYTLKVLFYRAGNGGGLQYHIKKTESFFLHSGEAVVRYDKGGELETVLMSPGQTFTIPSGAPHQFEAITDCLVYEASTPGSNDRVNVGERYGRPPAPGTLPTTYTDEQIATFEAGL